MVWKSLFLKMKFNTLDLHGIKHSDVKIEVENYLYLNQEDNRLKYILTKYYKIKKRMQLKNTHPPLSPF